MRLNTDAIDNSAGVNTSDVEVNIKIALSTPVRAGKLTIEARNELLAEMTDEVARLVLRNNYLQTPGAVAGAAPRPRRSRLPAAADAGRWSSASLLNRTVEFLPDDMTLAERRKRNRAADAAGARGAAGLCQAHAVQRPDRIQRCRTIHISAASSAAISRSEMSDVSRRR